MTLANHVDASLIENREHGLEEFHQEIMIMWSLRHPNIVQLVGYVESPPVIVSKLYDTDLFHLVHNNPDIFTDATVLSIAGQVARGMQVIHHSGVIHRDVKSPNVLVQYGNAPGKFTCAICDFGIARIIKAPKLANQKFYNVNGLSPRSASPDIIVGEIRRNSNDCFFVTQVHRPRGLCQVPREGFQLPASHRAEGGCVLVWHDPVRDPESQSSVG